MWDFFINLSIFINNLVTIIFLVISISLILTKRKEISIFSKILMTNFFQATYSRIEHKIEIIMEKIEKNEYEDATNGINKIIGIIKGDKLLSKELLTSVNALNKNIFDIKNKTLFKQKKSELIQRLFSLKQELKTIEYDNLKGNK